MPLQRANKRQPALGHAPKERPGALERDVKRVHEDVQELLELGLLERGEGGGVVCPFSGVHIDMELRAAA